MKTCNCSTQNESIGPTHQVQPPQEPPQKPSPYCLEIDSLASEVSRMEALTKQIREKLEGAMTPMMDSNIEKDCSAEKACVSSAIVEDIREIRLRVRADNISRENILRALEL